MAQATKNQPAPKPSSDKKKAERPTIAPAFLDNKGQLLMDSESTKNSKGEVRVKTFPKRLGIKDFPNTGEGRTKFCEYQIVFWTWKRDNWALKSAGDPAARKRRQIENLRKKLAALEETLND